MVQRDTSNESLGSGTTADEDEDESAEEQRLVSAGGRTYDMTSVDKDDDDDEDDDEENVRVRRDSVLDDDDLEELDLHFDLEEATEAPRTPSKFASDRDASSASTTPSPPSSAARKARRSHRRRSSGARIVSPPPRRSLGYSNSTEVIVDAASLSQSVTAQIQDVASGLAEGSRVAPVAVVEDAGEPANRLGRSPSLAGDLSAADLADLEAELEQMDDVEEQAVSPSKASSQSSSSSRRKKRRKKRKSKRRS